jgi:hypothetical protein
LEEGKARRSPDIGRVFWSSDVRHASPWGTSIHELEEASVPSPLVMEPGSNLQFGFELDEARLPLPLKTAGLVLIADIDNVLEEGMLLLPEVAGIILDMRSICFCSP